MNISLITTGHEPFDDRIFYHMARSLADNGWNTEIISSKYDLNETKDGILVNCFAGNELSKRDKISIFAGRLAEFSADVVICSEPLAILAARQYSANSNKKVKIIYDITEWYPSKKNLENIGRGIRWFAFLKLFIFNILASVLADGFIFGEWYKSRPYRILFPLKPFIFLSYYPDRKLFSNSPPCIEPGKLRLSFSGRISLEKGFGNFIEVIKELTSLIKDLKIEVKIIGWYESLKDKEDCEILIRQADQNVTFSFYNKQPLTDFINLINDTDIFLDLRMNDFENTRCLPIKIFYYAAIGRPVIFTNLRAVKKEVGVNKFGFLVDQNDKVRIAELISMYIMYPDIYLDHCQKARRLFETNYNWSVIEPILIEFINEISAG